VCAYVHSCAYQPTSAQIQNAPVQQKLHHPSVANHLSDAPTIWMAYRRLPHIKHSDAEFVVRLC